MVGAENIEKNLVNYFKAENDAQRICCPVSVEVCRVISRFLQGENDGKDRNLRDHVAEERRKYLLQFAPVHDAGDNRLQDGMCAPEHRASELGGIGHQRQTGLPARQPGTATTAPVAENSIRLD